MKTIDYKKFITTFDINARLILMSLGIDVDRIEAENALPESRALLLLMYKFLMEAGFDATIVTLVLKLFEADLDEHAMVIIMDNQFISTSKRTNMFDMHEQRWVATESSYMFIQCFALKPMKDRLLTPLIIG